MYVHQIHTVVAALVLCPTTARHKKLKEYTTPVHVQYVHTHMNPKVEIQEKLCYKLRMYVQQ